MLKIFSIIAFFKILTIEIHLVTIFVLLLIYENCVINYIR